MSMPRNNLDDVLRKRPPTSSSNSSSAVTGAGATAAKSKFRVGAGPSTPTRSKTMPAATDPLDGFFWPYSVGPVEAWRVDQREPPGSKTRGTRPANVPLSPTRGPRTPVMNLLSTDSPVAISSDDSSPSVPSTSYIPAKRVSPHSTNEHPSKRLRPSTMPQKENAIQQPVERSRLAPIRRIDFSQVASSSRPPALRIPSPLPKPEISTPSTLTAPVAIPHTTRHFAFDYSMLLDYSLSDLEDFKSSVVNFRGRWLDTLYADPVAGNRAEGDAQKLFKNVDHIFKDASYCASHLIQQRKAGETPSLPTGEWISTPHLPAPLQTAAPSSSPLSRTSNLPSSDGRPAFLAPATGVSLQDNSASFRGVPALSHATSDETIPASEDSDDGLWSGTELTMEELKQLDAMDTQPSFEPPHASSRFDIPSNSQAASGIVSVSSISSNTISSREPTIFPVAVEPVAGPSYPVLQGDALQKRLMKTLNDVFHLPSFRGNQMDIMRSYLSGKDVFVLKPTGGGKSLCFQLPAVMHNQDRDAITFVVCPLRALMDDQARKSHKYGIETVVLKATLEPQEREDAWNAIMARDGRRRACMAYITPEMLDKSVRLQNSLMTLRQSNKIAGFVIDEAHCIKSWKSFRTSYQELSSLRRNYPGVPILALTATAPPEVQADIRSRLGIEGCEMFTESFNRPNLHYYIKPKRAGVEVEMMEWIRAKHDGHTGIIYCSARDKCEKLAEKLRRNGFAADHFHANIDESEKKRVQLEWQAGKLKIITATIAFGMGIDKADVRYVIHADLPKSLDGYYQETGRAGRDGEPADCVLYWLYRDAQNKMEYVRQDVRKGEKTEEDAEQDIENIKRVVQYCENDIDCRRVQVLAFFGETFDKANCNGTCDNCVNPDPVQEEDVSEAATNLVHLSQELTQRRINVTQDRLIAIFTNKSGCSRGIDLADVQHKGLGKNVPLGLVERTVAYLLEHDVLTHRLVTNASGFNNTYIVPNDRKAVAFFRTSAAIVLTYRQRPTKQTRKRGKAKASIDAEENDQSIAGPSSRRTRAIRPVELPDDPIQEDETWDDSADYQDPDYMRGFEESNVIDLRSEDGDDVQVVEATNDEGEGIDPADRHGQCYEALKQLRDEIEIEKSLDLTDVFGDEQLQVISVVLPEDRADFKEQLRLADAPNMKSPNLQFIPRFLQVVFNWRTARCDVNTRSSDVQLNRLPTTSQLHSRYEYRGGSSSSKPSSRR